MLATLTLESGLDLQATLARENSSWAMLTIPAVAKKKKLWSA